MLIKPQEKISSSAKLSLDIARWKDTHFGLPYFSQLVEDLYSSEKVKQYRGLIGIRRFLSLGYPWKKLSVHRHLDHPNIQPVVDAKLVPRVIEFLLKEDEPEIQVTSSESSLENYQFHRLKLLGF